MRECILRLVLGCLLAQHGALSASGSDPFTLTSVAEGVYVHFGAHAALDDPGRGDSANLGVIVGETCVAVIDTGGAISTGKALRAEIRKRFGTPVCYVINTHVHFDHVLGNAAFVESAPEFAGHHALADAIEGNREFFAETFAAELGEAGDESMIIAPQRLVDGELELSLGGRAIILKSSVNAHSSTDLTVHDRKTNVMFTGDLLFRERLPVLDGNLKNWLAWMEASMAETYAVVVPGHGPADTQWPESARPQQEYLISLLRQTRKAIADGLFLEDAKAVVAREQLDGWILTERAHRLNVSRAFRELEWE